MIGQILRLALSSKHSPILSRLIRAKTGVRGLNIAKKMIEEELRRGDASAMDELSNLIIGGHHTEEMLSILLTYINNKDDRAVEIMYTLLARVGKERLPQTLIDFLYANVDPKGIKESDKLDERYNLFLRLYPLLFTGDQDKAKAFSNMSESSKRKIYTVFVNNRQFRNTENTQRDFFEGLYALSISGRSLYRAVDTLIPNSSNTQLTDKLNKLIRECRILMNSEFFQVGKGRQKIAQELVKCEDIGTALAELKNITAREAKTELKTLSQENVRRLVEHDELLKKVLHLNTHYAGLSAVHHKIYMTGVARFLLGKHDKFKYRDLEYLLEKYGATTNLTPTVTKKWIETRRENRIPESIKVVDANALLLRITTIKDSIKSRLQNRTLKKVQELLEQLEPIIGNLKPRDVDERMIIIRSLKDIISPLKKSGAEELVGTVSSIIRDIELSGSEKYLVTDEFEFNEAHDIGEHWGRCLSWSSSKAENRGLVAIMNDGTKKYIIVKDPTKKGRSWLAKAYMHLALRGKEFVIVLDDNTYSSLGEQRRIIQEFAQNKAEELGIPFVVGWSGIDRPFGKSPNFHSDSEGGTKEQQQIDSNFC